MIRQDDFAKVRKEISRRNLFRYMGNAAIALPFMRTLMETQAFGEVARKRAVIFFYPNGLPKTRFHPNETGTNFVLKDATRNLERIRNEIIIMNNLNYNIGGTHEDGLAYCLTGYGGRRKEVSIDTILGERMKVNASIPVLRLGTLARIHNQPLMNDCSFFAKDQPSQIENNPTRSFQKIFGGSATSPLAPNAPVTGLSVAAKKSVLDSSISELKRLQASIGTVEKAKLDSHVQSIREIERRLNTAGMPDNAVPSAQCTKVLRNKRTFPATGDEWLRDAAAIDVIDLNIEIGLQALACGVTNVLFIQNGSAGYYLKHNNAGLPSANGADAHSAGHDNPAQHALNTNYYMNKFADLVSGMGAIKEGDKSLLYHSSVMALSEFADAQDHSMRGVGVILAGQAGGYFKTGRCIDVRGASHNRVLVSLLQSLGYTDETFGDPNLGRGVLEALKG